jgi:hypothetical protein
MRVLGVVCCVLSLLCMEPARTATAQVPVDTTVRAVDTSQHPTPNTQIASDSVQRRPTTPTGAMFRSFLLPGWGQAVYGRKVTAGVMLGIEGLALGMLLKTGSELEHIRATGSASETAKLQEREDWYAILIFNHLMSGLEAYVSAHLYDFPGDLELQALPQGGMRVGVTLPLGGR